ncbi:MAG: hypothetical protein ACREBJ_11380 [Nitrosotalea sp.]
MNEQENDKPGESLEKRSDFMYRDETGKFRFAGHGNNAFIEGLRKLGFSENERNGIVIYNLNTQDYNAFVAYDYVYTFKWYVNLYKVYQDHVKSKYKKDQILFADEVKNILSYNRSLIRLNRRKFKNAFK